MRCGPPERAALNYLLADELVLAVRLDLRDVELRSLELAVLVEADGEAEDRMRDAGRVDLLEQLRATRGPVGARRLVRRRDDLRGHVGRRAERAPLRAVLLVVAGDHFRGPGQTVDVARERRDVRARDREVAGVEAVGAEDLGGLALLLHLLREELTVRGDLPRQEDDGRVGGHFRDE